MYHLLPYVSHTAFIKMNAYLATGAFPTEKRYFSFHIECR
jgi:hypothetical protein